jgi:O-succinylbenzoate synthase
MRDEALEGLLARAVPFRLPLRVRFRGTKERVGLLLRGEGGRWGEWAPFGDHPPEHAARWLEAACEAAFGHWPGGVPGRERVPVAGIVPALPRGEAAALAREAVERGGCGTIKVKVGERGQTELEDLDRVAVVREALGGGAGGAAGRIRVDANGAWDVGEAAGRLARLDAVARGPDGRGPGLEFAEQPCRSLPDLVALRRRTRVPLAADEALRLDLALNPGASQKSKQIQLLTHAADVLVLKAIPLGGVAAGLALAARLREAWAERGLPPPPVVVSGSLDSSIGLASGLALAAALPGPLLACGLGTGLLLAGDLVEPKDSLVPREGNLPVLRPEPSPERLAEAGAAVDAGTADALRARLREAWVHARTLRAVGGLPPAPIPALD